MASDTDDGRIHIQPTYERRHSSSPAPPEETEIPEISWVDRELLNGLKAGDHDRSQVALEAGADPELGLALMFKVHKLFDSTVSVTLIMMLKEFQSGLPKIESVEEDEEFYPPSDPSLSDADDSDSDDDHDDHGDVFISLSSDSDSDSDSGTEIVDDGNSSKDTMHTNTEPTLDRPVDERVNADDSSDDSDDTTFGFGEDENSASNSEADKDDRDSFFRDVRVTLEPDSRPNSPISDPVPEWKRALLTKKASTAAVAADKADKDNSILPVQIAASPNPISSSQFTPTPTALQADIDSLTAQVSTVPKWKQDILERRQSNPTPSDNHQKLENEPEIAVPIPGWKAAAMARAKAREEKERMADAERRLMEQQQAEAREKLEQKQREIERHRQKVAEEWRQAEEAKKIQRSEAAAAIANRMNNSQESTVKQDSSTHIWKPEVYDVDASVEQHVPHDPSGEQHVSEDIRSGQQTPSTTQAISIPDSIIYNKEKLRLHKCVVERKANMRYGLAINPGRHGHMLICNVKYDGLLFQQHKRVRKGCLLISINSQPTSEMSKDECIAIMQKSQGSTVLHISDRPQGVEDELQQYELIRSPPGSRSGSVKGMNRSRNGSGISQPRDRSPDGQKITRFRRASAKIQSKKFCHMVLTYEELYQRIPRNKLKKNQNQNSTKANGALRARRSSSDSIKRATVASNANNKASTKANGALRARRSSSKSMKKRAVPIADTSEDPHPHNSTLTVPANGLNTLPDSASRSRRSVIVAPGNGLSKANSSLPVVRQKNQNSNSKKVTKVKNRNPQRKGSSSSMESSKWEPEVYDVAASVKQSQPTAKLTWEPEEYDVLSPNGAATTVPSVVFEADPAASWQRSTSPSETKPFKSAYDLINEGSDEDSDEGVLFAPANSTHLSTLAGYEVDQLCIKPSKKIGSGQFGVVFSGKMNKTTQVAIKILRDELQSNLSALDEFLNEASVLKDMNHNNIIRLLAVVTKKSPMYVVTEFMDKGSLYDVVRKDKGKTIKGPRIVHIVMQIASGCAYIEYCNFVHRDLAARNILLNSTGICKIADFGMAQRVDSLPNKAFIALRTEIVPIRWSAPEAFKSRTFTIKSDVWSFGVVAYEAATYGLVELYKGLSNIEVPQQLAKGFRMPCPRNCPKILYDIMLSCWATEPHDRPFFEELESKLEEVYSLMTWNH